MGRFLFYSYYGVGFVSAKSWWGVTLFVSAKWLCRTALFEKRYSVTSYTYKGSRAKIDMRVEIGY